MSRNPLIRIRYSDGTATCRPHNPAVDYGWCFRNGRRRYSVDRGDIRKGDLVADDDADGIDRLTAVLSVETL